MATSDEDHEAADSLAELAGEILPPPASTVVKITRATHSAVRKSAKAKKTPPKRAPRPTAELTPAQQAGRRGGQAKPGFLRRVGR